MIRLCYLNPVLEHEQFYKQVVDLLSSLKKDDLLIKGYDLSWMNEPYGIHQTLYIQKVDLEIIGSQEIKNIVLLNFDSMEPKILRSLINLKSKKTEFIGISNNYNKEYENLQINIQEYKEQGFTSDQLSIMLILKNNLPVSLVNEIVSDSRTKTKNLNVKEIQSVGETRKFLK